MPLKYLNRFLFSINDKLKEKEFRKLVLYKKKCYDVLFNYFNQGFALNMAVCFSAKKEPLPQERWPNKSKKFQV